MKLTSSNKRTKDAFTLLELIVSVTVLVILIAIVSQSVTAIMQVSTLGRQQASKSMDARAIFDLIGVDLKEGIFRDDLASFRNETGATAVVFLTKRMAIGGDREISLVEYTYAPSRGELLRNSVAVPWQPSAGQPLIGFNQPATMPLAALLSQQTPIPLAEGVLGFQLYFLDGDGNYLSDYSQQARVARVALAICGPETANRLQELNLFSTITSQFDQQSPMQTSYLSYWTDRLEDSSFTSVMPSKLKGHIKIFERSYRLHHK